VLAREHIRSVCSYVLDIDIDGTEAMQVTPLRRTLVSFPHPNVLVAVSKGMQAVKLCSNKILQFLTGGAG